MEKKSSTRHNIKDTAAPTCKTEIFLFCKLKVYLFDILLGCVYKKITEATCTYIYCTCVKDYLLNLLGNVEVADSIASHVTQLTTLLSERAYKLIKPIEIDYNFIEVEDQYLFDIAGKRFIKESGSLKWSLRVFIRHEYSESKKPSPAPFIEGTHFHLAIFFGFQTVIFKIKWRSQRVFFATFKLLPWQKFVSHFIRSRLISHLHTPCHSLSRHITPYPLGWKQNHFHLATLKLVPRPQFFITSYHALSLLITPY